MLKKRTTNEAITHYFPNEKIVHTTNVAIIALTERVLGIPIAGSRVIKPFTAEATIVETEHYMFFDTRYIPPLWQLAISYIGSLSIGLLYFIYASDTPFTKAITLGTRSLGYEGVEATYVSSLAILRRIIEVETSK